MPVDASIGDGDTVLEALLALSGDVLPALVDVGLDHDTNDGVLAVPELLANILADKGLVLVVLARVAVRAVDHEDVLLGLLLGELSLSIRNARSVVVGALRAATEDDEAVVVAGGAGNGSKTLLGDTHEVVGVGSGLDGVNGDGEGAVSTVLEANGERYTGGELTVELRLGCAGADSGYGETVGKELAGC